MKKAWWSKTNLFGVLQIATGVIGVFGASDLIAQNPKAAAAVAAASGVVTIALRFITTVPIEW